MPGHSAVWKHYGASYEQLAKQPNTVLKPFPLVQDAKLLDTAAGKPSTLPARGCGSFVQQQSWSLGTGGHPQGLQRATETRSRYKQPPEDYQRREPIRTGAHCNFPVPNYPHEFRTVTQTVFDKDPKLRPGYQPTQPVKPPPPSQIMPVECNPPLFKTRAQEDFSAKARCGAGVRSAGYPATDNTGYNIITGGRSLTNNVFERWDNRDYRRHR